MSEWLGVPMYQDTAGEGPVCVERSSQSVAVMRGVGGTVVVENNRGEITVTRQAWEGQGQIELIRPSLGGADVDKEFWPPVVKVVAGSWEFRGVYPEEELIEFQIARRLTEKLRVDIEWNDGVGQPRVKLMKQAGDLAQELELERTGSGLWVNDKEDVAIRCGMARMDWRQVYQVEIDYMSMGQTVGIPVRLGIADTDVERVLAQQEGAWKKMVRKLDECFPVGMMRGLPEVPVLHLSELAEGQVGRSWS